MSDSELDTGQSALLVDLHCHTTFSDGLLTPEQVVSRARELGLVAVGITDHDAIDGIEKAASCGRSLGVEVVPGVEMSCNVNGVDLHMLGYYLDFRSSDVQEFFAGLRHHRSERARLMVEKMRELGVRVSFDDVRAVARGAAVGRPHVAQTLVNAGAVRSVEEAFRRYIGYDGPAYVPKKKLEPREAVEFTRRHGGVAVIAHPGTYHQDDVVYAAIAAGVDGIEVWHPDHNERAVARYEEIAQKNGLLTSGGSDCHGGRKNGKVFLGEVTVPYECLARIKRLAKERRG